MAEHTSPDQRPPNRARPDTAEAEKGAATTGGAGAGAWSRGRAYPNPPDHGWQESPPYPHPPDPTNPDPATLREQWLSATRRYCRWYSRAWGAAVLAGAAIFAAGWALKGSNPFPSRQGGHGNENEPPREAAGGQES